MDRDVIEQIFIFPQNSECVDLSKEMSLQLWNQRKRDYQGHTNDELLENKRSNFSKWPKTLHKSDFKQEINDLITLLSGFCGLTESDKFEPWMYKSIIRIFDNKEPIY